MTMHASEATAVVNEKVGLYPMTEENVLLKKQPKSVRSTKSSRALRKALVMVSKSDLNRKGPKEKSNPAKTVATAKPVATAKAAEPQKRELHVFEDGTDASSISSDSTVKVRVIPMGPQWDATSQAEVEAVIEKFHHDEPDPEDEDTWDVTMVAEYIPEIFNHLRDLEAKYAPDPDYVSHVQTDISWENRATLLNWIVQVHARFNLLPETLYLTVNLIDRFLSTVRISLSKFQLCGAVALFIAAKYEEINCPTVKQIAYMISNQYTPEEILKAERYMITQLDFDMGYPGPMSFLRRTSKADGYDSEIRTLAKYFLEVTIMDPRFVAAPCSWLAAGASYLALKMLHYGGWTDAHVYYSGYTEAQLAPLGKVLLECCINYKSHHRAIFDKYCERRFKRGALYVQEYIRKEQGGDAL